MPALVGEIWSQFLFVPLSEHGFIQLLCLREKLCILQVDWTVSHKLGENEVVHLKCEQAKSGELLWEQFRQAVRVAFWHIGDRNVLEIQAVLLGQCGALAAMRSRSATMFDGIAAI